MKVSKEELLHIVNLADLNLKEDEIDSYLEKFEDIVEFVEIINGAPVEKLNETIGANENSNVFRKDEAKVFENQKMIMDNAPEEELNMFKIPKVI